jgi:hypothetical protein
MFAPDQGTGVAFHVTRDLPKGRRQFAPRKRANANCPQGPETRASRGATSVAPSFFRRILRHPLRDLEKGYLSGLRCQQRWGQVEPVVSG